MYAVKKEFKNKRLEHLMGQIVIESQLSGVLTEPLNPREGLCYSLKGLCYSLKGLCYSLK